MTDDKRAFLMTMLAGAVSAGASVASGGAWPGERVAAGRNFDLGGATAWLNSPALSAASLRGKVVLVEFWTFSCINWRREYPYVRAWAAKYAKQGLVVIGVHSPEFAFEQDTANVARAVKAIGVTHPVAVDSAHAVWSAFDNAYWPALYAIDAKGRIRSEHFGEGAYDVSERFIQRLLREAGASDVPSDLVTPVFAGPEVQADWSNLHSPETYAGFARASNFASAGAVLNRPHAYALPARLSLNQWGLSGEWTLHAEAAVSNKAGGRAAFVFHARDLHLVMGAPEGAGDVAFRVSIDGAPPGAAHGTDIDAQGSGSLAGYRMYQLLRQPGPIADRRFEIEFDAPGAELFSFTFG